MEETNDNADLNMNDTGFKKEENISVDKEEQLHTRVTSGQLQRTSPRVTSGQFNDGCVLGEDNVTGSILKEISTVLPAGLSTGDFPTGLPNDMPSELTSWLATSNRNKNVYGSGANHLVQGFDDCSATFSESDHKWLTSNPTVTPSDGSINHLDEGVLLSAATHTEDRQKNSVQSGDVADKYNNLLIDMIQDMRHKLKDLTKVMHRLEMRNTILESKQVQQGHMLQQQATAMQCQSDTINELRSALIGKDVASKQLLEERMTDMIEKTDRVERNIQNQMTIQLVSANAKHESLTKKMSQTIDKHEKASNQHHQRLQLLETNLAHFEDGRLVLFQWNVGVSKALYEYKQQSEGGTDVRRFSDCFYLGNPGHCLCLSFKLGSNKDVCIGMYLLVGRHDDAVQWPFSGQFRLTVKIGSLQSTKEVHQVSFAEAPVDRAVLNNGICPEPCYFYKGTRVLSVDGLERKMRLHGNSVAIECAYTN